MSEQTSVAGYSDEQGNSGSPEGGFHKFGAAVRKVVADKKAAKADFLLKQAADALAAGALVTSGVFGTSTVEIYENGFVRVASVREGVNATQTESITKDTPYERLRSIKFGQPQEGQQSGANSPLESTIGPVAASLLKGGAGLFKATAPGLAVAGVAHLASNGARKSFLTIATDRAIHTLTNQVHNGFMNTSNKGHNEVGLALEAAGNSVLGSVGNVQPGGTVAAQPSGAVQPQEATQSAGAPTLSSRLRELAELHNEGILSDDEFSAAKATLLAGL